MIQKTWMNMWCSCVILSWAPLDTYAKVVKLDYMAVLFSVFWGISILISIVFILICIPSIIASTFHFSFSFTKICCLISLSTVVLTWGDQNLSLFLICNYLESKTVGYFSHSYWHCLLSSVAHYKFWCPFFNFLYFSY